MAVGVTAAALMLALSACAQAPTPGGDTNSPTATDTSTTATNSDFLACMVSDSGGFDDKSFNETSYKGVTDAKADLGIQEKHVQSTGAGDYDTNVQSMVDAGCNIIIGVGFNLAQAIAASAQTNPSINYALVDSAGADAQGNPVDLPNLKPLVFNTNEAAFLGGYLAASISKTGIVATYGGMALPSVTIYMDGYAQGIQYYNQQKGANVQLLGWKVGATQADGTFATGQNPFGDVSQGQTLAQTQIAAGADVLFPVAGNTGTGTLQAAQDSGGKVSALWVDTDGCVSAATYCSVMPTSVYKAMDVAVEAVIKDTLNGTFSSTPYVGTLKNNGVGISPFHDWDSKIDSTTKSELDTIKAAIIAGTITVTSPGAYTPNS